MASPTLDSRLADVAALLERRGWAAELWDPEWRLAWVTRGLKETIGEHDEEQLGYGRHLLECRLNDAWRRTVTDQTIERMLTDEVPYVLAETAGGIERLQAMVDEDLRPRLEGLTPIPPPPVRTSSIEFLQDRFRRRGWAS